MDDCKLMSVAVLQDNNHLRFPISTLSLSPIVNYDYSLIVNKRQTFHPEIRVQDPVEDNEANLLNGMVNRYSFNYKLANKSKSRKRHKSMHKNMKPLYDKNLTFEWYSNQSDINIGQDSISQRFEEDSRMFTDQYISIMERIKPQTLPILEKKLTQQTLQNKKPIIPKYLETKKPEQHGAVIQRHRDTIFIPQNLLSPDLMDQKKLGFLKEIVHLRRMHNKNISKSSPKVYHVKDETPQQSQQIQYLPSLQSERFSALDEQLVLLKMDHNGLTIKRNAKTKQLSKDNSVSTQKDISDSVPIVNEMQQITLPVLKDPYQNISQRSINIEKQALTKEEKKKQKLLEQRKRKIERMKGNLQQADSAKSDSSVTEDESPALDMEEIIQAQRAKFLQDEMKTCQKHAVMIKKIKGLTKKIIESHAKNSKSFSLERVMHHQVNIINHLNHKLPKISKHSMQELQEQFVNVLQPLKRL